MRTARVLLVSGWLLTVGCGGTSNSSTDVAQDTSTAERAEQSETGAVDATPEQGIDSSTFDAAPDVMSDNATSDRVDVLITDTMPMPDEGAEAAADAGCEDGSTFCTGDASYCAQLRNDPANCGMCGRTCPGGQNCNDGTCACSAGQQFCDGRCIDTRTSNLHCGMCGRTCTAGQNCVNGTCDCPTGQTLCGDRCVNASNDPTNCGMCGRSCAAEQACNMGMCVCPMGQALCAGSCVNLQTAQAHCGACGNACNSAQNCNAGTCTCPSGQTLCGGSCVNTASDREHCGGCGMACPAGQVCNGGTCGLTCSAPRVACGAGGAMACVDTSTDETNCGMCGRTCAAGQNCVAGSCACPMGRTACTSGGTTVCIDPTSDDANCGSCGTRCAPGANATSAFCSASRCSLICVPGFADCDGNPANGCEAALMTDTSNCGSCGNACSASGGSSAMCSAGQCAASSCRALLLNAPGLSDGVYSIDVDGPGPGPARPMYCDMRNGGWTLVLNQVAGMLLPNDMNTVNAANFGSLTTSYRLGVPEITAIRPTVAWRLTDPTNNVYLRPSCVVDWRTNYADMMTPTDCTVGYTTTSFSNVVNGRWVYCSARGIGINNSGQNCSIRGYEAEFNSAGMRLNGARTAGIAAPCLYNDASMRVQLWFQ